LNEFHYSHKSAVKRWNMYISRTYLLPSTS